MPLIDPPPLASTFFLFHFFFCKDGPMNNQNEPLYRGGCGHTDKEVEEAAVGCLVVSLVFILALVILFVFSLFVR